MILDTSSPACRTHKLFIITSGGCGNLADKFYNCFVDVRGSSMTAADVLESEEAYFLRKINERNNNRILKIVADELGLCIPSVVDTCAYDPHDIAIPTTVTMVNDLKRQKDGRITFTSKCVDTTCIENGALCRMHPSEGFWLFKGAIRHNSSANQYGASFGDESMQTCLPTSMNRVHGNYSWRSKVVPSSPVCNRPGSCMVQNRISSNVAKVDRDGNLISTGPTSMEQWVVRNGGRVPDAVAMEERATIPPTCDDEDDDESGSVVESIRSMSIISQQYMKHASSSMPRGGARDSSSMPPDAFAGHHAASRRYKTRAPTIASYSSLRSMGSAFGVHSCYGGSTGAGGGGGGPTLVDGMYTYMDEEYLRCLQSNMKWDRDSGIIYLMPIAVVYQEDMQ